MKRMGRLSFRPAIYKEKEPSAGWREAVVDSTTEALMVVQFAGRRLGPSAVARLVEPRLPKGECVVAQ